MVKDKKKRILYKKWQKSGDSKLKELYLGKKKRDLAVANEVESEEVVDQLQQNKSAAWQCLFGMARQSKNSKDIVGMSCIRGKNGNMERV